jgi:hypothetical protein
MSDDEKPDRYAIDDTRLDWEWHQQPDLYRAAARRLAKARLAESQAKAAVDVVHAEMAKRIRKAPGKFGIDKITEGAIEAEILTSDRYQTALAAHHQATYHAGLCMADVNSLNHRKSALENMVDLTLANYHSAPRPKGAKRRAAASRMERRPARGDDDD